jgi:hypothetical protein
MPHNRVTMDERHARRASSPLMRHAPKTGDVLASRRSARADLYTISMVPARLQTTAGSYSAAIDEVRTLAEEHQVDGWLTYDHTHYVPIVAHR